MDAGHGWLIFQLPPAEAAVHPDEHGNWHELFFSMHVMMDCVKIDLDEDEIRRLIDASALAAAGRGEVPRVDRAAKEDAGEARH